MQVTSSGGSYVYGKMSREIAEALCYNPGDYLVRASPTTGGLVLSVRFDQAECGHLSIHKTFSKTKHKVGYFFFHSRDNWHDMPLRSTVGFSNYVFFT